MSELFKFWLKLLGRAGRENLPGEVIIQTYNPDNFSIAYAKEQNYDKFFCAEIELRKRLKYPPFCDIIVMIFSSNDETDGKKLAKNWYEFLRKVGHDYLAIYPPMPAPISKINNKYRYRMILKGNISNHIIDILSAGIKQQEKWKIKKARTTIDVNPSNMM